MNQAATGVWPLLEPGNLTPLRGGAKNNPHTEKNRQACQTLTGRSEWAVVSGNEDVRLEEVLVVRK